MKKIAFLLALAGLTVFATCSKEEDKPAGGAQIEITDGYLTKSVWNDDFFYDVTWTKAT